MSQAPVNDQDVFGRQLESKNKKKASIGKKLLAAFLIVTAPVGAWLAFTSKGQETSKSIAPVIKVVQNPHLIFEHVGADQVNVLLVGEDYNWTVKPVFNPKTGKYAPFQVVDTESAPRSDTMIMMSLDKTDSVVRMLSLPRDARITYRDLDGDLHRKRKLNSVYATGGTDPQKRQDLLKQVLHDEFGIRVDRVAVIRPNGFKKLVDMVGGVQVNVDGALKLDRRTGKLYRGPIHYKDNWGQWEVNLNPGMQWLNGEQAHGYVRFRKDREGDPGRIRRQQMVMKAIAKRIMTKPIWELPDLAKQIQTQFSTDMSEEELVSLGYFAKNMGDASKVQPVTLYGVYAENGDIILNRSKNEKLLAAFFGGSFDPQNFLVRSPSTEGDDIGPANNTNPAIQAFLRQAGLLDPDSTPTPSAILTAPVREEDERGRPLRRAATRETSAEVPTRSRREESRTEEVTSEPEPTQAPRRKRRQRERANQPVPEAHHTQAPANESVPAASDPVSPVPVPEPGADGGVGGESPVPQPG